MVDENLTADNQPEGTETPAQPLVKVPPPESRFLFVDVAALRAKQLRRGARPRIVTAGEGEPTAEAPRKPERVAMEEVRQGLVIYEIPHVEPAPSGEPE